MEAESPSPYPQVPATCPYPEATPSSPYDPLQIPEDPSSYYPLIYVLVPPMASFPQASPPIPCTQLYPPPYESHSLPISFVSIYQRTIFRKVYRSFISSLCRHTRISFLRILYIKSTQMNCHLN